MIKEVTYEEWQKNPTPRMMWVWDSNENAKQKRKVIYFIDQNTPYPVVALSYDGTITANFKHCAEIETQRRMTNRELACWLSDKPRRECKYKSRGCIYNTIAYREETQDEKAPADILIRENGGEWKEPLMEVV